ncbi:MAG: sialate O-acetylesterase [Opitutus sp.]|nr:sialate O-acetylesterase [Opitutus sp.]
MLSKIILAWIFHGAATPSSRFNRKPRRGRRGPGIQGAFPLRSHGKISRLSRVHAVEPRFCSENETTEKWSELTSTRFGLGPLTFSGLRSSRSTWTESLRLSLILTALGLALAARAEVTLAPLFTDRAVLQRDKIVPIWGRADVGEKITVTFAGQRRESTPAADGRWIVLLDPLASSTQGTELTVAGKNTITLRDIVVGEVWLCSGQSNMEFTVEARPGWQANSRAANAGAEIAAANFPLIRHVRIAQTVAEMPADTVKTGGWETATPQTVGGFTAVGYFFARDLYQKFGVPVGIVHSSWGGTPVESWMSPAALASDPAFKVVGERWQRTVADFPATQTAYEAKLAEWTQADANAKNAPPAKALPPTKAKGAPKADPAAAYREWLRKNPRPRAPRGPGDPWTPAGLFNGMINPLLPYALRGALWYQGESNAGRAAEYHALFTAMIKAWRAHSAQGDIPFYWVNLANYSVADTDGRSFASLREAQTKALALPNTGQAIAIDIGNAKDIHPTNKQEVGRRLALLAKRRVYGMTGDDTGPTFVGATREGATLRVRFAQASGGLVAHEKPVQALELAGEDRVFHPADGKIDRDMLVVSSPAVRAPVAVRYAWTNAPEANLYNGTGLPAVPFRSDEW